MKNFSFKIEFIIKIPEIKDIPDVKAVQRYIIDIDIDSFLKTKVEEDKTWNRSRSIEVLSEDYPAFAVSIDFIDYVVAKNFFRTVEEWFEGLELASNPTWLLHLARFFSIRPVFFIQAGYLGAALFITTFTFYHKAGGSTADIYYMISLTLVFFVVTSFSCRELFEYYCRAIALCVIPPSLVLTKGDERALSTVARKASSVTPTLLRFVAGITLSLSLNVIASYVYAWLIR